MPWFTSTVRVDVVPVASREGAFTSIDPAPAPITISSANPNLTGWMAAEIIFHEASHALARPILQGFGAEAKAQGKDVRDIWHVALFYMTGEIVRQALAERDVVYEPLSLQDRASRACVATVQGAYRDALEALCWRRGLAGAGDQERGGRDQIAIAG